MRSETQRSPFTRSVSWNPQDLHGSDFDCTCVPLFLACKIVLMPGCPCLQSVSDMRLWQNAQAIFCLRCLPTCACGKMRKQIPVLKSVSAMRLWQDAQVCSRAKSTPQLCFLDPCFASIGTQSGDKNSRNTRHPVPLMMGVFLNGHRPWNRAHSSAKGCERRAPTQEPCIQEGCG